jgi:hypothetical protein
MGPSMSGTVFLREIAAWTAQAIGNFVAHPAEIRTKRVRKRKTDRQDAQLILRLMLKDRFS